MTAHRVSVIENKDFLSANVRVGDLDGDGAPDLLMAQIDFCTLEITCLTATDLFGRVLWQVGTPGTGVSADYDLPVAIHDWDGDGHNEVLWIEQATYLEITAYDLVHGGEPTVKVSHKGELRGRRDLVLTGVNRWEGAAVVHVLDSRTGREKLHFPAPALAYNCMIFCDLRGTGRPADMVVKDSYKNLWGIANNGEELWHWAGSTGHFPSVADIDGDGRDEVFTGFALLDHDGTVVFDHDPRGSHMDAAFPFRMPDGSWRLLFGNHGVHCLAGDGTELWCHPLAEAQHVMCGRLCQDSPAQVAVIDRGQHSASGKRGPATLYLFTLDGNEIWRKDLGPESWCASMRLIDWHGGGRPQCLLLTSLGTGTPALVMDGEGRVVDELPLVHSDGRQVDTGIQLGADIWGDSREEVILPSAKVLNIYANARPLSVNRLINNTFYPGL